jgi:hypothetical protein
VTSADSSSQPEDPDAQPESPQEQAQPELPKPRNHRTSGATLQALVGKAKRLLHRHY